MEAIVEEEKAGHRPGWEHYARNCALQWQEWEEFHVWRFCHDDKWEVQIKDIKKIHKIDRHNIKLIKCLDWDNEQIPSENWEKCSKPFAKYVCLKCNLYDDDGLEKQLFHCDDCGICRQGGKETAFHCKNCDICLPLSAKDDHVCTNYREAVCAICMEGFYNVRDGGCLLACGHLIHGDCFDQYFTNKIWWPICKKFAFNNEAKEVIYQHIRQEIENTPLGEELSSMKVDIICNDWFAKSTTNFHIVALQCKNCEGYNTTRIKDMDKPHEGM